MHPRGTCPPRGAPSKQRPEFSEIRAERGKHHPKTGKVEPVGRVDPVTPGAADTPRDEGKHPRANYSHMLRRRFYIFTPVLGNIGITERGPPEFAENAPRPLLNIAAHVFTGVRTAPANKTSHCAGP